jgi:hypothetical protein
MRPLARRLAALERAARRVRLIAVADLADPLPPSAAARPGETVLIVATGIRRELDEIDR